MKKLFFALLMAFAISSFSQPNTGTCIATCNMYKVNVLSAQKEIRINSSTTGTLTAAQTIVIGGGSSTNDIKGLFITNTVVSTGVNNYGIINSVQGSNTANVGEDARVNSSAGQNFGYIAEVGVTGSGTAWGFQADIACDGVSKYFDAVILTNTATVATGFNATCANLHGSGIQNNTGFKAILDQSGAYNTGIYLQCEGAATNTAINVVSGNIHFDALNASSVLALDASKNVVSTGVSTIASGVFTPTLTNTTNVAASTPYQCQYLRVGNIVTVSGKVDIDVTLAASTASELQMTLPIASNFSAEENAGGTASSDAIASDVARIKADSSSKRASLVFKAISLTNDSYNFSFTYYIVAFP